MTKRIHPHPSQELLEEYVLHRLTEARVAQIEEHLLICEVCRESVRELDVFVSTMKAAAAAPATSQMRHLATSSRMGASALALLFLALVVFWTRPMDSPKPAEVILSSIRGVESGAVVSAGRPLRLHIDAPDLVGGKTYRVAVVDAAGRSVWTGRGTIDGAKISAEISKPLMSGVYWVRLYDTEDRQVREFGMSVK